MALVGLLCLCLLASLVGSYPLTDESSNFEGPIFTPVSIGMPTAEDMMDHKADTKIVAIAPRSLKSLFGLGIGGNLLGINAGAGISHGRGGWGEVGMHSGHPAYVPYYETPNQYYY
ncbi:uncharacterized protein LOC124368606 [Homalodisca vitripennis]|uniref:uncharacterized protein LOC124368606 n=1 Tax=Homalodisca vitripennis TaxID=197043 RepID=UPI001EEA2B38|nr:uncharacterized protein LOC124368606 [Homalodisca vitripennis]KAG8241515.1 hypothetical protein J6590_085423 [Homalodisca vitripennis]